jgi:thymidylate kinase
MTLVVVSGCDGAGKSTVMDLLCQQNNLYQKAHWSEFAEYLGFQKPAADLIQEMQPATRALFLLLLNSGLSEHMIEPMRRQGKVVVCESYYFKFLAKERTFGIAQPDLVERLTALPPPNLIVNISIDPNIAFSRLALAHEQVNQLGRLDVSENSVPSGALRKMHEVFGPIDSPLMLNIFVQANKVMHRSEISVQEMSNEQFSDYLFDTYIERMMSRRPGRHGTDLTLKWLGYLANYIDDHGLAEFQLDRITPQSVLRSSVVWMSAAAMGIVTGLIAGLLDGIGYGLVHGTHRGIANGIVVGMLFGLFVGLRAYDLTMQLENGSKKRNILLVAGGTMWLALFSALLLGIKAVAVFPLFFVVAYLVFARFSSTGPVEQVKWSWQPSLKGFFWGFLVGAPCGAIDGLRDNFKSFPILFGFSLAFGCAAGIFGSIAVGLRPKLVSARMRPNEGVHRSAMRALAFGVTFTIVGSFAFLVPFTLLARSEVPFGASIRLGLVLGMAASLLGGGLNLLEHITTRIALVITGRAPLNYVRFLNEAADMQLLYRAGSGYLFRHRSLLSHLSRMPQYKL